MHLSLTWDGRVWFECIWLRTGDYFEHGDNTSVAVRCWGFYWVDESLLTSQNISHVRIT